MQQRNHSHGPAGAADAIGVEQLAAMRSEFLKRVYGHLAAAVAVLVLLEILLFSSGLAVPIANAFTGNWLLVLGGFIVAGWVGRAFAYRADSLTSQYTGLGIYVLAQAIIFVPLLAIAQAVAPGAIQSAALITAIGFTLLTMLALSMRHDFSVLGGLLKWAGIVALLAIVGGVIFGFHLGTWFSVGMVALAGAAVLFDTQKILTSYRDDQYVGASLELFASIAMMFWYVLRILIGSRR
jgi:FtsH-binding integral membrane protein